MHPRNKFVLTFLALGAWYAVGDPFLRSRLQSELKSAHESSPHQPTLVEVCDPLFDNVKLLYGERVQISSQCAYLTNLMLDPMDTCSPEQRRAMEEGYDQASTRLAVAEQQLRQLGCDTLPSFTAFYRRIHRV